MRGPLRANGKHFECSTGPTRMCGVTYGSFRRRADGARFPDEPVGRSDFEAFRRHGVNAIRTYEIPPPDILDLAAEFEIGVLAGLHYHDWRTESSSSRAARRRIRDAANRAVDDALAAVADRPEVVALAVGNEIPVDLVRVHGHRSVERVLVGMIDRIHDGAHDLLATYVNYPTTEYLHVPNQDFVAFNVFLEDVDDFRRYLAHLQLLGGDRPVVITELGLASEIHGEVEQDRSLRAQLACVDEEGLAGAFVFSWTDEWAVADEPVTGWGFGLTTADRTPKPALRACSEWATSSYPKSLRDSWPRISVVVCAYNEESTIGACVDSLLASNYPDLEVIVCDDGSTDRTAELVAERPVNLLALDHAGLSHARNAGLAAASGEIVAYLDADAACHPDWPFHLAISMESGVAATGGPNLPVPGGGLVERAISHVPGQASEVLLGPGRAEHVPGCNMAFRRALLTELGGFDVRYTAAGDDVDICWRLLDEGHEIAFSPAAQVLHHRRSSVRGFLRQQRGYGKAERMLSGPHAQRLNVFGQARWRGFVYGPGALLPNILRPRVYTGWFGSAPFQPIISHRSRSLGNYVAATLPLVAVAGVISLVLGVALRPALFVTAAAVEWYLIVFAAAAASAHLDHREAARGRVRFLVGLLSVLQPPTRFWGRLRGVPLHAAPRPPPIWSGDRLGWVEALEHELHALSRRVTRGRDGVFWDLRTTDRGPVDAYVTTAVVWNWEPRAVIRYRLRRSWVLVLSAAMAIGLLAGPMWALGAGALSTAAIALSWYRTRRSVLTALSHTTTAAIG